MHDAGPAHGWIPDCTEAQGYDFDVCLRRASTGQWIGCAASYDNNYEYLDVPCYSNEMWYIDIMPYWGTNHTTAKVGWAFATD